MEDNILDVNTLVTTLDAESYTREKLQFLDSHIKELSSLILNLYQAGQDLRLEIGKGLVLRDLNFQEFDKTEAYANLDKIVKEMKSIDDQIIKAVALREQYQKNP